MIINGIALNYIKMSTKNSIDGDLHFCSDQMENAHTHLGGCTLIDELFARVHWHLKFRGFGAVGMQLRIWTKNPIKKFTFIRINFRKKAQFTSLVYTKEKVLFCITLQSRNDFCSQKIHISS